MNSKWGFAKTSPKEPIPWEARNMENKGNTSLLSKWDSEGTLSLQREFEGGALISDPSETPYKAIPGACCPGDE